MRLIVRVVFVAITALALVALLYACTPSGGAADGGADAGTLSCSSVCTAKAAMCGASASETSTGCATLCAMHPTQSELACAQASLCSALIASFDEGKPICTGADAGEAGKAGDRTDGDMDVQLQNDVHIGDGNRGDTNDATLQDAGMDGPQKDSSPDAPDAGTCTVALSGGASGTYACSSTVSYGPSSGLLMNVSVPGMGIFTFGGKLASTNNFAAGQMYMNPDEGTAIHSENEGVWVYATSPSYGIALITVSSIGTQWVDDAGTGDIYFAGAYGDMTVTLEPQDPPFATGEITAQVHWVTSFGSIPDAGMPDASPDASSDGSTDAGADVAGGGMFKCVMTLSGGETTPPDAGLPCTSSAELIEGMLTNLTISQTGSGNTSTLTIYFPGQFANLNGQRTSASPCSPTADCSAAATVTEGSGATATQWSRTWAASDVASTMPWFNLTVLDNGTCTPTGTPDVETCANYLATFTATLPPTTGDAGALMVSVTGITSQ